MYGSLVCLAVSCASFNAKGRCNGGTRKRLFTQNAAGSLCVCGCTRHRHRAVHMPEHAGTHVARQHITLLLGPQSQHEPRLQGEAEGCPWLLRKLCLDFPAMSLGMAAATAWTCSQPSVGLRNSSERAVVSPRGWGREGSRCRVEGGSK